MVDFDKLCDLATKKMRFDLYDYSKSMSLALADEELCRRYSKASSDIRDYIIQEYNPQGMNFSVASKFFDSDKGEFVPIPSGKFCYVRPDRDAKLKELVDNAKKLFRARNNVHADSNQCDKRIISSELNGSIIRLQVKVSKLLNISRDDASKLVRENGELIGKAATYTVISKSDIKKECETAKLYYDLLHKYDNMSENEKYHTGNKIRTYLLEDIAKTYERVKTELGLSTARQVFEKACKEENRDPKVIANAIEIDY